MVNRVRWCLEAIEDLVIERVSVANSNGIERETNTLTSNSSSRYISVKLRTEMIDLESKYTLLDL